MANNGHQYIPRLALPVLIPLLLAALLAKYYYGWIPAIIIFGIFLILCFLFRDPKREVPSSPLAVVSPASGYITGISKETDQWMDRTAIKYRIKMSLWDVHSLRSPAEGKVMNEWASTDKKSGFRRQYTYWIQTDEGDDVVLSILMGLSALIVRLTPRCGERVGQGQPFGFLFFAGMIDVYLPENTKIRIESGMQVKSGTDVLGQLVHGKDTPVT